MAEEQNNNVPNEGLTNKFGQTFEDLNTSLYRNNELENSINRIRGMYQNPSDATSQLSGANVANSFDLSNNQLEESLIDLSPQDIKIEDVFDENTTFGLQKKYDTFKVGVDNEDRLAKDQSTITKWMNGMTKLSGKTLTNVIGGTVGSLMSIQDAVSEGSFSALFDNDIMNALDDMNSFMDNKLPNYISQEERDMNFVQKLGTANFWANDLTNAVSFLAGAAITEGLWAAATGGASLTTTIARQGLRAKQALGGILNLHKSAGRKMFKNALKNEAKNTAIGRSKAAKALNTVRFAATSAGYEAGVEARHYLHSAKENFIEEYKLNNNGEMPSADEMNAFMNDATEAANSLFSFNMALVGSSNVMTLGRLFGVAPKVGIADRLGKGINKRVFGVGSKLDKATGKLTELAPTKYQKLALGTFTKGKAAFREGFMEEGLQASASNAAERWIESRYSPSAQDKNLGIMESFYEGMSHTYGSKEGWNEIGIGMLVGAMSSAFTGEHKDGKRLRERNKQEIEGRNQYQHTDFILDIAARRNEMANQQQVINEEIEAAQREGRVADEKDAVYRSLVTKAFFDHSIGESNASIENIESLLDTVNDEALMKELGVQSEQEVAEFKKNTLETYRDINERASKNLETADAVFGDNIQDKGNNVNTHAVKQAFAFALTMGETSFDTSREMLDMLKESVGSDVIASIIDNYDLLQNIDPKTRTGLKEMSEQLRTIDQELQQLDKEALKEQTKVSEDLSKDVDSRLNVGKQTQQTESKNLKELNKLNENIQRREELLEKREQLSKDLENLKVATSISNPFSNDQGNNLDFVTVDNLTAMEDSLGQLDTYLDNLRRTNPLRALEVEKILAEYKSASRNLKQYNDAVNMLLDKDVKFTEKSMFNNSKLNKKSKELVSYLENLASELVDENTKLQAVRKGREEAREALEDTEVVGDSIKPAETEVTPETETTTRPSETALEKLKNRVDRLVKSNRALEYVGIEPETTSKPTKEDVKRYNYLKKKALRDGRIPNKVLRIKNPDALDQEFQDLARKLADWRLVSSITDSGASLIDLLDRVEILEREVQEATVASEVREEDIIKESSSIETTESNNDKSIGQVYDSAVVQNNNFIDRKFLRISHLKPETLIGYINNTWPNANVKFMDSSNKEVSSIEAALNTLGGDVSPYMRVNIGVNNYDVKLISRGRMEIGLEDFEAMNLPLKNLKPAGIGSTWSDLYEVKEDGTLEILGSDFKLEESKSNAEVMFSFDRNTLENVQEGDSLTVSLDFRTRHNKDVLREQYRQGKITLDEFLAQVEIFVKKGGKIVQVLKASEESDAQDSNHTLLRQSFREPAIAFLNGSTTVENSEINIDAKVNVKKVFVGRPRLSARIDEQGNSVLDYKDLDNKTIRKVVDYGFTDANGNLELKNNTQLDSTNSRDISKSHTTTNAGKKVPVAVVKEGNKYIVVPVRLNEVARDYTEDVDAILDDQTLSKQEAANALLNLASENGLDPNSYFNNREEIDVKSLLEDLNGLEQTVSTQGWMDRGHSAQDLIGQVQIPLDLNGRVLTYPKLQLDLDGLTDSLEEGNKFAISFQTDTSVSSTYSKEDRLSILDTMISTGVRSFSELQGRLARLIFNNKGNINISSLGLTGLFNKLEKNYLLRSNESKKDFIELVRKITNDEVTEFSLSEVDNLFATFDPYSFNTLGKQKQVGNPVANREQFFKDSVGMTEEQFENHVMNSPYENLKEEYRRNQDFRESLFEESSTYQLLQDLGTIDSDNINILPEYVQAANVAINFLGVISDEVWNESEAEVLEALQELIDSLDGSGIVLPTNKEMYNDRQNTIQLFGALNIFLVNPNDGSLSALTNKVSEISETVQQPTKLVKVDKKHTNKTLVYKETDKSNYEVFAEEGLLFVEEGVYQRVNKDVDLEDLYQQFFESDNVPEEVYTIRDLKEYIKGNIKNLDKKVGEKVDLVEAQKMAIYTEYFNNPYEKTNSDTVAGETTVTDSLQSRIDNANFTYLAGKFALDFFKLIKDKMKVLSPEENRELSTPREATPAEYSSAMSKALERQSKSGKKINLQVDEISEERARAIVEAGGKLFITGDGKAGAFVESDGYMGGLFKDPTSNLKGVAKVLQDARINEGGKYFDAYGTELEDIYIKNGFRPVARLRFNEEFAPEGWNDADSPLSTKPDVVFFAYDPRGKYSKGDGQYFESYDEAKKVAVEFEPSEGTGEGTQKFFGDVVTGKSEKYVPAKGYEYESEFTPQQEKFRKGYDEKKGNFDEHIATSIPTFRDTQVKKGNAIVQSYKGQEGGALVYDLGGSEGGFVKTITEESNGNIKTINLDPSPEMSEAFEKGKPSGSKMILEAFGQGWEGVPTHKPEQKADVVHESMMFQFIEDGGERRAKIQEVKDNYLKKDGVFITEQKFKGDPNYAENEEIKNTQHKNKYYTEDQIRSKGEEVLVGMSENQANINQYLTELRQQFDYVQVYWKAGNFSGIIATNNQAKFNEFLENLGDTSNQYNYDGSSKKGVREDIYNNLLSMFEVSTNSIRIKDGVQADVFTNMMEIYKDELTEMGVYKDLVDYLTFSKKPNPINTEILEGETMETTVETRRSIFANKPSLLEKSDIEHSTIKSGDISGEGKVIAVREDLIDDQKDFIRLTDGTVFERVEKVGDNVILYRLPDLSGVGGELNILTKIPAPKISKDLRKQISKLNLTNSKNSVSKKYSKDQSDKIDEDNTCR